MFLIPNTCASYIVYMYPMVSEKVASFCIPYYWCDTFLQGGYNVRGYSNAGLAEMVILLIPFRPLQFYWWMVQ